MDFITNNNDNNPEGIPQIKEDVMVAISTVNQLKQQLATKKLHFLEINKILEKCINIFLHASQEQMEKSDSETLPSEDFLPLHNILSVICCFSQQQPEEGGSVKEHFALSIATNLFVCVDHKYFSRAVELLIREIFKHTLTNELLTISTKVNYNQSILIIFDNNSNKIETIASICDSVLLQEIFALQGIVLEARIMEGKAVAAMRIPAYRSYVTEPCEATS